MKVNFLGTNGWYDSSTGNTICVLIETNNEYIVLDAGNGIHKLDRHVDSKRPIYIFLSHFHLDHVIGLHILNKFDFPQGIQICGQTGTRNVLKTLINKPFTTSLEDISYRSEIIELPEERDRLPFNIESESLLHTSTTLGYRLEVDDGVMIAYCPDTGYCENAVKLARNADLLIAECAYRSKQHNDKWPHLNPEDAARIAVNANAKRLALIHFDAYFYQTLKERVYAEEQAKKIFSNTFAALDDMEIIV